MTRFLLLSTLLLLLGCGSNVAKNPDPVQIEGRVTQASKPVSGVTLNLQPTGAGAQATIPLKGGAFKGAVVPGTYTYFVSEGPSAAAYKAIPAKYRAGSLDRQIEIAAGSSLNLTLD